jgi:hypothetical protein
MGKAGNSDSDDDFFYYGTPLDDEAPQTQLRSAPQDPSQTRALPLHQQVHCCCSPPSLRRRCL